MNVIFKRTGERRYAVSIEIAGKLLQGVDPAPGFDEHIPHDLVHYVVEAELGMTAGVFGRAANGGGTFILRPQGALSPRERARERRKQQRRELSLGTADTAGHNDMLNSERLAGICDLAWRRHHGQSPNPALWKPSEALSPEDAERVKRVVARLDELAPLWKSLKVGETLTFTWPSVVPDRLQAK